jgi:benzoyl-CoA 2,3-dioxygenase component B
MLTEEAHHMFVGDTGISRVIRRTIEVMRSLGSDDPQRIRAEGAIDLPTLQRYLNFWCSSSLDLFGSEISTNAASYFANGLKGRPDEAQYQDHVCREAQFAIEKPQGAGGIASEEVPLRNAMNEIVRRAYLKDCDIGVQRWNRIIRKAGVAFEFRLPSERFRRAVGLWAGLSFDPAGTPVAPEDWERRKGEWLPSEADKDFVQSLMKPVVAPGKMAGWIAPPERGINNLPVDYEYVRL